MSPTPRRKDKEVLSSLPRTRPQMRSARRAAAPEGAPASASASPKAKPSASTKATPSASPKAKPRASAKAKPSASTRTKPKVSAGTRASKPQTPPRTERPPEQLRPIEPPSGPEIVGAAVQTAGELAQIGMAVGKHLLRSAASRLTGR